MKKFLSGFLAFVMAFGIFCSVPFTESPFKFTVNAASVSDLTFGLNDDGESYYVSSCDTTANGDLTIPSTYNGSPVTSIGNDAFEDCTSLTTITIPDSVTSIGSSAFYSCTSLTSVTIPDSVTRINGAVFRNCTSLKSITIPNGVTIIGGYTFYGCTSLTSITIPDSVIEIVDRAFPDCTNLSDVYYAGTGDDWNSISIGYNYNTDLTNATIHCSVTDPTNHWNGTFKDPTCTEAGIKNGSCSCGYSVNETVAATGHKSGVWITDKTPTCTEAGSKHKECTVCKEVLETGTIDKIEHKYVQKSVQAEHPHKITYECTACKDTKAESSVVSQCVECNFTITPIDSSSYNLVSYIGEETDVVIPTTYKERAITTISNGCFRNNSNITSVKIESGVTSIGSIVFMNCTSLQKVYIPASVTSIGINAFYKFTGTIYCTSGSAAYEYAVANNLNYVVLNIVETANTRIDYDNFIIRTSVQNCGELTDIFGVADTVTAIPIASYIYGKLGLYGTGTIISVFDGDEYVGDYTLIVEGDTNGDSACDVLDCFNVEHSLNGNGELSGVYKSAADINEDGAVDVNDYQAVVNRALG